MADSVVSPEKQNLIGQFEISKVFKDDPPPKGDHDVSYPSSKEMGIQGSAEFNGPFEGIKFERAFKRLHDFTLDSDDKEWGNNRDDPNYGKTKEHTLEDGTSMSIINEGPNSVSIRVKKVEGQDASGAFYFKRNLPTDSRGEGGVLEIRGFGKGEGFDLNKDLSRAEELVGTVLATLPAPES